LSEGLRSKVIRTTHEPPHNRTKGVSIPRGVHQERKTAGGNRPVWREGSYSRRFRRLRWSWVWMSAASMLQFTWTPTYHGVSLAASGSRRTFRKTRTHAPLEQHFASRPLELLSRTMEAAASANPLNPMLLRRHLLAAANEYPLRLPPPNPPAARCAEGSGCSLTYNFVTF